MNWFMNGFVIVLKWMVGGIICAAILFMPLITLAQGTVCFSNLGQSSTGTNYVGRDNLAVEVQFLTGTNVFGYNLGSIQLLMLGASATSTSATLGYFIVDVHGLNSGSPVNYFVGNSNPRSGGILTYTPTSAVTLLPSTVYWLSLSAFGMYPGDDYYWSYANLNTPTTNIDGWSLTGSITSSSGQASGFPQFAILATTMTSPVPEPKTWALVMIGLAAFLVINLRCHDLR